MSNKLVKRKSQEELMAELVYVYHWVDCHKAWLPLNRRYRKPMVDSEYDREFVNSTKEECVEISAPENRSIWLWDDSCAPWDSAENMSLYRERVGVIQRGEDALLADCGSVPFPAPRPTGYAAHGSQSKQVGLRMPLALVERLDAIAKEHKVSRSSVIVLLLENSV